MRSASDCTCKKHAPASGSNPVFQLQSPSCTSLLNSPAHSSADCSCAAQLRSGDYRLFASDNYWCSKTIRFPSVERIRYDKGPEAVDKWPELEEHLVASVAAVG